LAASGKRRKLQTGVTLRSFLYGHGDVQQVTYDPEGVVAAGGTLLKPALGVARRIATTLVRRAIRGGFKRFAKTTARPGIGSKVTKGPLMLGKKVVLGKARPGIGKLAVGGAAIAGAGAASVVAQHRQARLAASPATASAPAPRAPAPRPSAPKSERKCCPVGTKRMVCFKRGRVKKKKAKPKKAKPRRKATRRKTRKRKTRKRRK
jgi:hypothetical protein